MRILSLFSGAGGLDLGLKWAGHEIVWANDIYDDAVKTYKRNIGNHIVARDICKVRASEIPDADVVVGGFPCQGFSIANWGRTASDPRNQMYRQVVRVVRAKRPQFFVAENVKGLVSLKGGAVLDKILHDFSLIGYNVTHAVVNAADYGVPQTRMRLLIVGVRSDTRAVLRFPPSPTHARPDIAQAEGLAPWKTVAQAVARFPAPGDLRIPNHECSKYKLTFNGHLGHRFVEPSRPAPTVTARGDEKGGVVVLHHPSNRRRMTARELAAVQSFPDDFVFIGTKTSAYRQIANAVPPLLGKAIGLMLREAEEKLTRNARKRAA